MENKPKITPTNVQEIWDRIVNINKEAAIEVLGTKNTNKNKRVEAHEIEILSLEQKAVRTRIDESKDKEERIQLRKVRKQKLRRIKQIKDMKEQDIIMKIVEEIEKQKDDSRKMFEVIKQSQSKNPKKPLLVKNKEGFTANEAEKVEEITKFFNDFFTNENAEQIEDIKPTEMRSKFTKEEVKKAVISLKKNKCPGIDELRAEQLQYGPEEVFEEIAHLLNEVASTGNAPTELTLGILNPLQKPGKIIGPCGN